MKNYIFLGSSAYSLKILKTMIECSDARPFCLIDANMTEKRKNYILDEISPFLDKEAMFDAKLLNDIAFIDDLSRHKLDWGISVNFSLKLRKSFLSIINRGVVNLHPSFLPYNRGHWPEVWAIINNTPAGITLHFIDEELDTGDIIKQVEIPILLEDTGETICQKTEAAGIELIKSVWPEILKNNISRKFQKNKYPLNRRIDFDKLLEIDLDKNYKGIELINMLRALTMPSFSLRPYFIDPTSGEKIFINFGLQRNAHESCSFRNSVDKGALLEG